MTNSRKGNSFSGLPGCGLQPRQNNMMSGCLFFLGASFSNWALACCRLISLRCTCKNVCGPISSPLVNKFGEKAWTMHRSSLFRTRERHMYPLSWDSREGVESQRPRSTVQAGKVAPMNECAVPEKSHASGNPFRATVALPLVSNGQC